MIIKKKENKTADDKNFFFFDNYRTKYSFVKNKNQLRVPKKKKTRLIEKKS